MADQAGGVPLPDPLTPSDSDLRDYPYMPLDVVRLRDSMLAGVPNPEAFRAAVISWCVAWHQVPAASLPDDDATLCRLLGYGRDHKTWTRVRSGGALHGYIKCNDGRLYHPVVAEKAWEAIDRRRKQSERGAKGGQEKWRKQRESLAQAGSPDSASSDESCLKQERKPAQASQGGCLSIAPEMLSDSHRKQGNGKQGNGEERKVPPNPPLTRRAVNEPDADFDRFWTIYPRKAEGPGAARGPWAKALKIATPDDIVVGLQRYPFQPDYLPMASTWLNQKRWQTQPDTRPPNAVAPTNGGGLFGALMRSRASAGNTEDEPDDARTVEADHEGYQWSDPANG